METKAQTPADGVMVLKQYDDFLLYRTACDCSSPGHDTTVCIERTGDLIGVTFGVTVTTAYWKQRVPVNYISWTAPFALFANGVLNRIALAYDVLVKGYIEQEMDFLLGQQQATNVAHAILDGIDSVKPTKKVPPKPTPAQTNGVREKVASDNSTAAQPATKKKPRRPRSRKAAGDVARPSKGVQ